MSYTLTIAEKIEASNAEAFKKLTEGSQPSPPIAVFDPTPKNMRIDFYSTSNSLAIFSVFINAYVDVDLTIQEKVSGLSDSITVQFYTDVYVPTPQNPEL